MPKKIYQELATLTDARLRCIQMDNKEWEEKHTEKIEEMVKRFPIDDPIFDFYESNGQKLVIHSSYHHMNENGFWDGYSDFTIKVTSDLMFGFKLSILGKFPRKYESTKDYLHELISSELDKIYE